MIPSSVTLSNAVSANQSSSMVLNHVYWIRHKVADTSPRPHKVSTKILGCGIFMVGVVVLSIGLIIGVEFPLYVSEKIIQDQCILNKDHTYYEKWYRDEAYSRTNRVYYWTVKNPADFIKGDTPQFVQKGPYVYKEQRLRMNIGFANNRISYQTMISQTFSAADTRRHCGSSCTQYDEITLLNTELLQTLHAYGGWDNYISVYVPLFITDHLSNWTKIVPDDHQLYTYLGCVTDECMNTHEHNTTVSKEEVRKLSFGAFMQQNNTESKQTLLESNQFITVNQHIDNILMKTMYTNLAEVTPFVNVIHKQCMKTTQQAVTSLKLNLVTSDTSVLPTKIINEYVNSSNGDQTIKTFMFLPGCCFASAVLSFLHHLYHFSDWPMLLWSVSICDGDGTCHVLTDSFVSVSALFLVAKDYFDYHLLSLVAGAVMALPGNGVIQTRQQHQLATGYTRKPLAMTPGSRIDVPGALVHHIDFMDAFIRSPKHVVSTCLDEGKLDTNMVVREYNGSQFAPPGLYADGNQRLFGHTLNFPPSQICRACSKPLPNGHHYDLFIEDIFRTVKYTNGVEMEKHDNQVYRFSLTTDSLQGTEPCKLINVTSVRGYPSLVGLPFYSDSGCEHLERLLQPPFSTPTSYMDIEPRTGRIWDSTTKLQTSVTIPSVFQGEVTHSPYNNISYINHPIPVFWVDKSINIQQSEIDYYDFKIDRLMNVSCGGLIGLVIVSVFIMAISVFVLLMSNRKHKVVPVVEDSLNNRP